MCFPNEFRTNQLQSLYSRFGDFQKHRSAALFSEREAFLLHLLSCGVLKSNVQSAACFLLRAVKVLKLTQLRVVEAEEIEQAVRRIWGQRLSDDSDFVGCRAAYSFRSIVRKWLRFHKCLKINKQHFGRAPRRIKVYRDYLISRQLATPTIESCCRDATNLLNWINARHLSLSRMSLKDVDRFLLFKRKQGWALATVGSTAQGVRTFLKYAAMRGWCKSELYLGIRRLAGSRHSVGQPKARKWDEVKSLLASLKTDDSQASTRARAALLLISHYALRISELARLRTTDFDFKAFALTVRRSKNGQLQRYPLNREVVDAVRRYLKARRRNINQLFLTIKTPYRPAHRKTFYSITHYRFAALGITTGRRGPHSIRHARAMELLRRGASLREIGTFLGHRHPLSALTYSKFTIETLRRVAKFSLGALL
jgi:site-specific recombinase XerD